MTKGNKCDNCGKGIMYGSQHKHHSGVAGGRWLRKAQHTQKIFKPNLHNARIKVGTGYKAMRLCTKCLRILKNQKLILKSEVQKDADSQVQSPVVTV